MAIPRDPAMSEAVEEARALMTPVLTTAKRGDGTATSSSGSTTAGQEAPSAAASVSLDIPAAIRILNRIDAAVRDDQTKVRAKNELPSFDSEVVKHVYYLLDCIIVLGIYPFMQQHTKIPYDRRDRSVLFNQSTPLPEPDLRTFEAALLALNRLVEEPTVGVASLVIDQSFMDIVSGNAWFCFGTGSAPGKEQLLASFERVVEKLLFTCTGLVASSLPEPVRTRLTAILSRLPMRPGGVLQTIEFVAVKHARGEKAAPAQGSQSEALPLPIEALLECAKLFSVLPKGQDFSYFSVTGEQLLDLLNEKAGPELSKAAAFIITQGILNKKSSGAPGTWGWNFYVAPLIERLNPNPSFTGTHEASRSTDSAQPWVNDSDTKTALTLLGKLILVRPQASIPARLIPPVLLSLWGISIFAKVRTVDPVYESLSWSLLKTFFTLAPSAQQLKTLQTHLLWDGIPDWTYGPGSQGGIEIRPRQEPKDTQDITGIVKRVDVAVGQFMELMSIAGISGEEKAAIGLSAVEDWLLSQDGGVGGGMTSSTSTKNLLGGPEEEDVKKDPTRNLLRMKLAQGILKDYSSLITATPTRTLDLVIKICRARLHRAWSGSNAHKLQISPKDLEEDRGQLEDETILAIGLEILSLVLRTSDPETIESLKAQWKEISTLLRQLLTELTPPLSDELRDSVTAALSQIQQPEPASAEDRGLDVDSTEEEHLRLIASAEESLTASEPPIRRQAIQHIEQLVRSTSKVKGAVTFAATLIDAIEREEDDFVFQPAIDAYVSLAMKADHTVVAMAIQAFDDAQQKLGIDSRQRLAEALIRLTTRKSEARAMALRTGWPASARDMAGAAIKVASRRGARTREMQQRVRAAEQRQKLEQERNEAWGGEAPDVPLIEPGETEKDRLDAELLTGIIMGWQETGRNEDIRVRSSALSILAQLLESAFDLVAGEFWVPTEELALSILFMERGPEKVILRRNAVLMFLSTLLALDAAREKNDAVDTLTEKIDWTKIEKVLRWVLDMDEDELVKDHVQSVLESLDAWRMNMLLKGQEEPLTTVTIGDDLRGLDINPLKKANTTSKKPVIEEID